MSQQTNDVQNSGLAYEIEDNNIEEIKQVVEQTPEKIETSNFSETQIKKGKDQKIGKVKSEIEAKEDKILVTSQILSQEKEVLNIETGTLSALSSIKGHVNETSQS